MSAYQKIIVVVIAVLALGCTSEQADSLYTTNDEAARLYYNTTLKPIIDTKCISCHIYHLEGANRYDDYEKTKSNIAQIVSRVNSTSNTVMPPADAVQLTEDEIASFQEFVTLLNSDEAEAPRVQVMWTAYKYPDFENRAGVSGTFDTITYELNEDFVNPTDMLDGATVSIETSSVNVGDEPERTQNVFTFFSSFTPAISGTVISYTDSEAVIEFVMNEITQVVTFEITVQSDRLILSGVIPDMNIFNWQAGYDALEAVCGDYHENKVWEDIDIVAEISLEE